MPTRNKSLFIAESKCKHDQGFTLTVFSCADRLPAYFCNCLCGFKLNFDPSWAGAIRDHDVRCIPVLSESWRLFTTAYRVSEKHKVIGMTSSRY